ncbi:tRNA (5-methylaminomethyl-2-thiouridine)(34)-methyltransferase MnmD [Alphaproteobacteria bacterium]|nr:tRNA (5-methylaminomethyl-2-thiouridine)(34)-methyltransferase MnmD [Alphaproteobacteria bacterium]
MKNNLINPKFSISSKLGIYSKSYNDIYFDKLNGPKETEHVYLNTNNLPKKFKNKQKFVIAEIGFGTGLNFLLTWKLWKENRKTNGSLTYISFENAPLSKKDIERVYKKFKKLDGYSRFLLKNIPERCKSTHRIFIKADNINLILIYDDITSLINFNFKADTWFLDGFSPKKNPLVWTDKLFKQLYNFTNLDGSLSTFSVAGHIRRGLLKAGFKVSKLSGFGNKKEISYAIKKDLISSNQYKFSCEKKIGPVAIIGSGISGASLAYALRKRNIECFIIDKSYKLANGASGNKLALQMPKLTMDDSPYGLLSLEAFLYSRKIAKNLNAIPRSDGLVLIPSRDRDIIKFKKLLENNWPLDLLNNNYDKLNFLKFINHIHMKSSGIVDNSKFIQNLIKDVEFISKFDVKKITSKDGLNIIIDKFGNRLKSKTVIWANGFEMTNLNQNLPINPISGQVTYLKANELSSNLKINFSYGHHFSQAFKGYHQIGASFNRNTNTCFREIDQNTNINSIPEFLRKNIYYNINESGHRVSVRASTKDRMPFFDDLSALTGKKSNNIYILGGMGAWGFVYAPFYAELLVTKIINDQLVINSKLEKLLTIERLL